MFSPHRWHFETNLMFCLLAGLHDTPVRTLQSRFLHEQPTDPFSPNFNLLTGTNSMYIQLDTGLVKKHFLRILTPVAAFY